MFRNSDGYIGNDVYKTYANRTFNNTNTIIKHINNHSNDVINNYKMDKINNVKQTYCNFNDDITLNKTHDKYSNDTYNVFQTGNTFNTTDNQYFTKK